MGRDDDSLQSDTHRELIIVLTAQHRLPAVYPGRIFVQRRFNLLWA